jgi:inward rectifier potassium channel
MNWTVVHPINLDSPVRIQLGRHEKSDLEIYVSVRGFDDVYSNVVQQRTSYTFLKFYLTGNLFRCTVESSDGKTTIVELQRLHEHREIRLKV